ncbi:MAG: tyrosine-type recombinase/integrase, partial [Clostridia bacterium]
GSTGELISSGMLDKKFKRVLSMAGLSDIRFHDLRHTFATLLLKKNVPAKVVSHLLGHSTIGITLDTYSHVITEMQDIAVAAINEILDY